MGAEQTKNKFTIISILLIIAILISAVAVYTFIYLEDEKNTIDEDEQNNNQNTNNSSTVQTTPYNISATDADELIKTNSNLTIIDCRGLEGCSSCQFNKGHLPGAEMNINPSTLFNTTNDILVYSKDGTAGYYNYSIHLIDHAEGTVYNLEGGYSAWISAGFEIEKN